MTSPAREALRSAQAALEAARSSLADAERVHEGADALVIQAQETVRSIELREESSGRKVAEAIKSAIRTGAALPQTAHAEAGRERAQAQAELATREAALRHLAAELEEARARERFAAEALNKAVRGVLIEDAVSAARHGMRALEMMFAAHRQTSGADRAGYGPGALPLPAEVVEFLRMVPEPNDSPAEAGRAFVLWQAYRARLQTDADAACPDGSIPPPAPVPQVTGGAA